MGDTLLVCDGAGAQSGPNNKSLPAAVTLKRAPGMNYSLTQHQRIQKVMIIQIPSKTPSLLHDSSVINCFIFHTD